MSQTDNEQTPANGLYVGEIRLLPFRYNQLPFGWYFCNGERFLLTSPQGETMSGLTEEFRADWGMEEDLCSISLPNLFHEDGRGCFLRPVDGLTRQVGAVEGDAIRNITGRVGGGSNNRVFWIGLQDAGAFQGTDNDGYASSAVKLTNGGGTTATFDASRVVPTAPENRPLNLGMTPAIYLGV